MKTTKGTVKRLAAYIIAAALVFAALTPLGTVRAVDEQAPAIATSGQHSLVVTADGSLYGWGANIYGQVIPANGLDQLTAKAVSLSNVKTVATGATHSLALTASGDVYAWGGNDYGQLGDGTRYATATPKLVLSGVKAIAAGYNNSMAIKTDGTLWVWGSNMNGQSGDNTRADTLTPKKLMDSVAFISSGYMHSAAIKTDGTLYVWGGNAYGQIGDGTVATSYAPKQILTGVKSVSAGGAHTLAVKDDGTLWAWGSTAYGQIGDGTRGGVQLTPKKIMSDVVSVAAGNAIINLAGTGAYASPGNLSGNIAEDIALMALLMQGSGHSLALKTDGTVWAWGANQYGQLGNGQSYESATPVKVLSDAVAVAAGCNMSMALKSNGDVYTWGGNNYGQLGNNSRIDSNTPKLAYSGVRVTSNVQATRSNDAVTLNGASVAFDAFKIDGSNYYKLRDIAFALKDAAETQKRVGVEYDEATRTVKLTRGGTYAPVGGEMSPGTGAPGSVKPSTHNVTLDGQALAISGYNIDGSNYFKLRDLMKLLNVYVGYDDATRTVTLDTSRGYEN